MRVSDAIVPRGDFLLVQKEMIEEELGAGLVAPDIAETKRMSASSIVVSRGPAAPMVYAPGSRVFHGRYAGTEVALQEGGESLYLVPSMEVRGYIPAEDENAAS